MKIELARLPIESPTTYGFRLTSEDGKVDILPIPDGGIHFASDGTYTLIRIESRGKRS